MAQHRFAHTREDWRRLRPVSQRVKTAVRDAVDAWYCRRPPPDAAQLDAVRRAIAGRPAAITVAFNTPWVIDLQARLAARFLPDAAYVVGDNSSNPLLAEEIRRLCEATGGHYVRLPPNPSRAPSRSHGFALNWLYRNLVAPAAPTVAAFIDHDLFPIEPIDLVAKLAGQPFTGLAKAHRFGDRRLLSGEVPWYLWAGYVVIDVAKVAALKPDFRQDWFTGMDTGGMMWRRIYRRFDRAGLRLVETAQQMKQYVPVATGTLVYSEFDGWLHTGNASEHMPEPMQRRALLVDVICRRAGFDDLRADLEPHPPQS
ncbi:MAG: hypothetical protein H6843_13520 [Rhodospirillaceae bacterium]|nr:hypothetical protein [Rhodospirillaceae bacterium]